MEYDEQVGIDWSWLAIDDAMTKAPLGGEKTGSNPTDRTKGGPNARSFATRQGFRSGLRTTAQNRHDMKLMEATLVSSLSARPIPTDQSRQHLCLDRGYDYSKVRSCSGASSSTGYVQSRDQERV
ncbi:MAG: hypothetical protein QM679_01745 [Patulibacter sp.]